MRVFGHVLVCMLGLGCGLKPYTLESASGDGSSGAGAASSGDATLGGSVTGAAGSTTGGELETGTLEGSGSSSGGVETCGPQGEDPEPGSGDKTCDQWVQDCPEGCKCMPYSGDGDNSWESLKCTPVMPDAGGLGDPCMAIGSGVSGIDSCAKGYMCWSVDPETLMGECVEQCKGSPSMPYCTDDSWTSCQIAADGALTICLGGCHPFKKPCEKATDECVPNPVDPNSWICVIDASGEEGQAFDPCEYANSCDPGLVCVQSTLAMECDPQVAGCCLPLCELSAPVCPGVGQECLPWYEMGQAPPMFEDIGICGIPQ